MRTRVVATVDPAALGRIDQIVQSLIQAGMVVEQILSATGIISGSADDSQMVALRAVTGIASVERETDFQAPIDGGPQ